MELESRVIKAHIRKIWGITALALLFSAFPIYYMYRETSNMIDYINRERNPIHMIDIEQKEEEEIESPQDNCVIYYTLDC